MGFGVGGNIRGPDVWREWTYEVASHFVLAGVVVGVCDADGVVCGRFADAGPSSVGQDDGVHGDDVGPSFWVSDEGDADDDVTHMAANVVRPARISVVKRDPARVLGWPEPSRWNQRPTAESATRMLSLWAQSCMVGWSCAGSGRGRRGGGKRTEREKRAGGCAGYL